MFCKNMCSKQIFINLLSYTKKQTIESCQLPPTHCSTQTYLEIIDITINSTL